MSWIDDYVDILGKAEGTEKHTDAGGVETEAYGITAKSGLKKMEGETAKEFAKRAVEHYSAKAEAKLGDKWDTLPDGLKAVATDIAYNSGVASAPTFWKELKAGNYSEALKQTLDIVSDQSMDDDGAKRVFPGLGKRKAAMYNLGAEDAGVPKIKSMTAAESEGTTYLKYVNDDGTDLTVKIGRPLASGSSTALDVPTYTLKGAAAPGMPADMDNMTPAVAVEGQTPPVQGAGQELDVFRNAPGMLGMQQNRRYSF
jgi:GH24 family phage-related lysozyme (muramidase)